MFTEQGVAMLSSVLNSSVAINVNIQIIRVFTKIREMLLGHNAILAEIEKIRSEVGNHSKHIEIIFKYLKQLELAKKKEIEQQNRTPIGYKIKREE